MIKTRFALVFTVISKVIEFLKKCSISINSSDDGCLRVWPLFY